MACVEKQTKGKEIYINIRLKTLENIIEVAILSVRVSQSPSIKEGSRICTLQKEGALFRALALNGQLISLKVHIVVIVHINILVYVPLRGRW